MLFVFSALAQCQWWEFNPKDFKKKIQNSDKLPIYAVYFSSLCHFCHGVDERFRAMSDSLSLPRDVVFTAINCTQHASTCGKLDISGYPAFLYIPRPEKRYWERPGYQDPTDWRKFILAKLKSNLIDATASTDDDHFRMVEETLNGYTIFEMIVSNDDHLVASNYEALSIDLRNTTSRFLFKRNWENPEQITAYLSPECSIHSSDVANVSDFLLSHKFSHFHKYKFDEWTDILRWQNLTILFTQGKIRSDGIALLRLLSRQFCQQSMIGWAPIGHSFRMLKQLIAGDQFRAFVAHVSADGCKYLFRDEISPDAVAQFLGAVVAGKEECFRDVRSSGRTAETRVFFSRQNAVVRCTVGFLFLAVAFFLLWRIRRARFTARRAIGEVQVFKAQ
jgi:hypothetical protein